MYKKEIVNNQQEKALLDVYTEVRDFRNNQNHRSLNNTKVYNDKEKCLEKYNQVLEIIKKSYEDIYD